MKFQLLALALTAFATLSTATNIEFEGEYIRTEKLSHDGRKCLEWEVGVETPGNRHHRSYIIPKCIKWRTAKEDWNYKLKVVKVKQDCLGWGVVVHGEHARCVCSKVQKRDLSVSNPRLAGRDDQDKEMPEGRVVRYDQVSKPGLECHGWRPYEVEAGDSDSYPTIAPKCYDWRPMKGTAKDIVYDTTVLNIEFGCAEWSIHADSNAGGNKVRPYCALGTEKSPSETLKMEAVKRIPAAPIVANSAPRGLFKDVQKTIHTLQSQLAQAQHKHHLAKTLKVAASTKQSTKTEDQSMLQKMQQTVQAMQTRLARAKHSVHAHFSPTLASPEGGIDQGVLQDLQHSVHTLQAQLAQARHVVHAHTGTKDAAKKMDSEGLDQGVLQGMQHSAHKLQSELSKARRALHESITKRGDVERGEGEEVKF